MFSLEPGVMKTEMNTFIYFFFTSLSFAGACICICITEKSKSLHRENVFSPRVGTG